jgi:hypothetical protein
MTRFCVFMAVLALFGCFLNAVQQRGHMMAWSLIVAVLWIGAALYWSGQFG